MPVIIHALSDPMIFILATGCIFFVVWGIGGNRAAGAVLIASLLVCAFAFDGNGFDHLTKNPLTHVILGFGFPLLAMGLYYYLGLSPRRLAATWGIFQRLPLALASGCIILGAAYLFPALRTLAVYSLPCVLLAWGVFGRTGAWGTLLTTYALIVASYLFLWQNFDKPDALQIAGIAFALAFIWSCLLYLCLCLFTDGPNEPLYVSEFPQPWRFITALALLGCLGAIAHTCPNERAGRLFYATHGTTKQNRADYLTDFFKKYRYSRHACDTSYEGLLRRSMGDNDTASTRILMQAFAQCSKTYGQEAYTLTTMLPAFIEQDNRLAMEFLAENGLPDSTLLPLEQKQLTLVEYARAKGQPEMVQLLQNRVQWR